MVLWPFALLFHSTDARQSYFLQINQEGFEVLVPFSSSFWMNPSDGNIVKGSSNGYSALSHFDYAAGYDGTTSWKESIFGAVSKQIIENTTSVAWNFPAPKQDWLASRGLFLASIYALQFSLANRKPAHVKLRKIQEMMRKTR